MNIEEIEEFKQKIETTILPHVINMNQQQIINLIQNVEKNNNLKEGFGNMIMEQILILKQTHFNNTH